jgi:DNA-binding transcriptional MerR regulator
MRINEAAEQLGLSQRALKYYEKEGLLEVRRDENGYRNYSTQDLERLKKISLYRKLGIAIKDIESLLNTEDPARLREILAQKRDQLQQDQTQLQSLEKYLDDGNLDEAFQQIDYETIGQAIQDMFPGFTGYYFMHHFMPYLQMRFTTPEQQAAYQRILTFWDTTTIHVPLFTRLISYLQYKLNRLNLFDQTETMEKRMRQMIEMSDHDYEKLKKQVLSGVKMKTSFPMKYHPAFVSQRKFMKRLQDAGYNDIFIPSMIALSPTYKRYHDALTAVNQRLCDDLGLYYDSNYVLRLKKKDLG